MDTLCRRFIPENINDTVGGKIATANEILRVTVGSELFGTSLGTGDHDEMGIYIEPPEFIYGLQTMPKVYQYRDQPTGVSSKEGDVDLSIYSLRHWLSLAMQGNPTVLSPLFASEEFVIFIDEIGYDLRALTKVLISKRAFPQFRGYLLSQKKRFSGQKEMPSRAPLIEEHGHDTKAAMHALRLGIQGIELMKTGSLELPMSAGNKEYLLAVRRGEVSRKAVEDDLELLEARLEHALEVSPLPDAPNVEFLSHWLVKSHENHWKKNVRI